MSTSDIRDGKFSSLVYLSLIVGGVVLFGFMKDIFGDGLFSGKTISLFEYVLTFDANADSWFPMYQAAVEKLNHPELNLYQTIFFENKIKFQYPPASLLPFMGLVWLDTVGSSCWRR
ncbi:MAG: hypothetical protein WDZ54_02480 [Sneathiella sp.]